MRLCECISHSTPQVYVCLVMLCCTGPLSVKSYLTYIMSAVFQSCICVNVRMYALCDHEMSLNCCSCCLGLFQCIVKIVCTHICTELPALLTFQVIFWYQQQHQAIHIQTLNSLNLWAIFNFWTHFIWNSPNSWQWPKTIARNALAQSDYHREHPRITTILFGFSCGFSIF